MALVADLGQSLPLPSPTSPPWRARSASTVVPSFTMRLAEVIASLLFLLAAPSVHAGIINGPRPRSQYEGFKVVRIPTGPSAKALAKLKGLVDSLDLELWTTNPRTNSHMDVMIPPESFKSFMNAAEKLTKEAGIAQSLAIMHENLGESIAEESRVPEEFHRARKRDGGHRISLHILIG